MEASRDELWMALRPKSYLNLNLPLQVFENQPPPPAFTSPEAELTDLPG